MSTRNRNYDPRLGERLVCLAKSPNSDKSEVVAFGPVKLPVQIGGTNQAFDWYTFLECEAADDMVAAVKEGRSLPSSIETKGVTDSALVVGLDRLANEPNVVPLVRVHSCCATGDIFGSLRCDCGPQISAAMRLIQENGCGAVIYLAGHEGRGIGLFAKAMAYALQDEGLDTFEANLQLGLPEDARHFDVAGRIIQHLFPNHPISLLTNNPEKLTDLQAGGVRLSGRQQLVEGRNSANEVYLSAKKNRGHMLEPIQYSNGDA